MWPAVRLTASTWQHWLTLCLLCGCALLAVPGPVLAADAAVSVPAAWELQPYRVQVQLAWGSTVDLPLATRERVVQDFADAAERVVAAGWELSTTVECQFSPATRAQVEQLTTADFTGDWLTIQREKTFLVVIEQRGAQWGLTSREWDHSARNLGPVAQSELADLRELGGVLFRQLHRQFRPLARIEQIAQGEVTIAVRAGQLPPADPTGQLLQPHQFWVPFYRFRSKADAAQVEKIQPVPWTLLRTADISVVAEGRATCDVISGIRVPLTNRRRAQIDLLALLTRPTGTSTQLQAVSQRDQEQPLVGLTIEVRPDVPAPAPDKPAVAVPIQERLITDRSGRVRITRSPTEPLVWLTVKSHAKVLARLPLLVGAEAAVRAELPDHALILALTGELSLLESRLTDTVAQRAVLMARIKQLAQLNQWEQVTPLRKELVSLAGVDAYLKDLTSIRITTVRRAQQQQDKVAAATAERLCRETSVLIQKYLDADKIKAFDEELRELRLESGSDPQRGSPGPGRMPATPAGSAKTTP